MNIRMVTMVYEAGLVYIQFMLPPPDQISHYGADESTMVCSWQVLRCLTLPTEPKAAEMHKENGDLEPAVLISA